MPTESHKVDELRQSAQDLAKQALETAELGLRLVRGQFDNVVRPGAGAEMPRNFQDATLNAETKAKEMFTLATNFMQELNEKWQPGRGAAGEDKPADKPRPEKINIDVE